MRGKIQSLRRVFYRQADVVASVNENNLLVILPSERFSELCKEFVVLFVRFGQLKLQRKILLNEAFLLKPDIQAVFFSDGQKPEHCHKEEIDEMQILASWIYQHQQSLSCLYIKPFGSASAVLNELAERLLRLAGATDIEAAAELTK